MDLYFVKFIFKIKHPTVFNTLPLISQDDLLMGTLTVRENIAFSAALRLPHSALSRKQRAEKVETVINELGLSDIADSKVRTINRHCSMLQRS